MPKKTMAAVLVAAIAIVAATALFNIRPLQEPAPEPYSDFEETAVAPEPQPVPSIYEVKLTGGTVFLYAFDASGTELSKTPIDYIDVYSLYQSQIEVLRTGARFDSREAAAEFIQDLGS